MEPKTVEEDLKEVSEDELLANWKDHKWNWLWYVAVFLVFIVIFYYMF
jgi:phosphatidylglycerophosphatase A